MSEIKKVEIPTLLLRMTTEATDCWFIRGDGVVKGEARRTETTAKDGLYLVSSDSFALPCVIYMRKEDLFIVESAAKEALIGLLEERIRAAQQRILELKESTPRKKRDERYTEKG